MSQQKVVNKLERKIKLDTNKRNKRFLAKQAAKQIKDFNFVATLDYSDPRTQVFLLLLLSANVIGTQANRPSQPSSQSLTSTSTPLTDSTVSDTHNATNIVTNALPPSEIPIQNVASPASVTFFSHQFAAAQMSARQSFSSFFSEKNEVCVVPSRNQVTEPFLSIMHDYKKGYFNAAVRKIPIIEDVNTLYMKFTLVNVGSENRIYLATDKDGNEIAVRAYTRNGFSLERISRKFTLGSSAALSAYDRLVETRKFSSYIPEVFAFYYAKNTNFHGLPYPVEPDDFLFCTELEFIPRDHESLYRINGTNQLMEPRTLFESVLGYYVVKKVARCSINDPDGDVERHYLYCEDKNPVCYQIGNDLYLFPPGISPRKVDYDYLLKRMNDHDNFGIEEESFLFNHASEEMRSFLQDINQKGKLFESIKLHFSKFLISEEELKNYPNAKCFNLTELANTELQQSTQPEANASQLRI